MMEVKHNTPMEFTDLVSSTNELSNSLRSLADVEGTTLEDIPIDKVQLIPNLKKSSLEVVVDNKVKTNESITNGSNISKNVMGKTGSKSPLPQAVDLEDEELDKAAAITPELEDELLADDEAEDVDKLLTIVPPSTKIPIDVNDGESPSEELEKTVEKSTEKPAASNHINAQRDPGDDLDTLLSKINDIVEDCTVPTSEVKKSEDITSTEDENIEKSSDNSETKASDTHEITMEDSVIVLDDSVSEEVPVESESKRGVKDTANDTTKDSTLSNNEGEHEKEKEAVLKLAEEEEKEEARKSSAKNAEVAMEQEEEISASDKILLEVDLEALNEEQLPIQPTETDSSKKSIENSKTDGESERIEEEKSHSDEKSVENNMEDIALIAESEKNSIEEHKDKVAENIVKDIINTDAAVASHGDESASIVTEKLTDQDKKEEKIVDQAIEPCTEVKDSKEEPAKTSVEISNTHDSDDDVVFFCVKSNDRVNAEQTDTAPKSLKKIDEATNEESKQKEKVKENDDDDDVVLLDDDEDDMLASVDKTTTALTTKVDKSPSTDLEPLTDTNSLSKSSEKKEVDPTVKEFDKQLANDATDNARDKFSDGDEAENLIEEIPMLPQKSGDAEESNSNCSSSSNLLQESKAVASIEGCEDEADMGNDDDDDAIDNDCDAGGEVEILDTDVGDEESKEGVDADASEDKEEPPAKRIRLSKSDEDDDNSKLSTDNTAIEESSSQDVIAKTTDTVVANDKTTSEDVRDTTIKTDDEKTSMKRPHDDSLVEGDTKIIDTKKLKTDESLVGDDKQKAEISDTTSIDLKNEIIEIKDVKEDDELLKTSQTASKAEEQQTVEEEKLVINNIKVVPSHIPVPLYPPPVFEDPVPDFSYDFLKRFKKSLDRLTKSDLEELVMQKIAEAIIHKSEFGEMRELIEKQEKTIAAHRTKITELSKQFRDLEMVHNRVLKDIETKNSQFLMPVKITRAVGLQVFIPLKKNTDPATNAAANTVGVSSSSQQTSQYRSTANSSSQPPPLTSPLRSGNNIDSSASSSSTSLQQRSSNNLSSTTSSAANLNTRRGCVQKTTPQRPLESASLGSAQSSGPASYRTVQLASTVSPQIPVKVLNKSASSTSVSSSASASAIAQMRNRYSGSGSTSTTSLQQQQQQQQISRQQPSPTNNVRKLPTAAVPTKQNSSSCISQQYRRIEPKSQISNSVDSPTENYMSSVHQVPTVSITPAKPKDKSVIDLTDEDDAPNATTATAATTTTPTPAALQRPRAANATGNSATTGGSSNYILNKVAASNVRVSPVGVNNTSKPAARQQMSNLYGPSSKSNGNSPVPTNISTPPGTSITRIQVAAGTQRVKYGHPAPLPPTPAQNLHPAWKLPPPRPTIRISNLDNGIVISWTVEESMDRHAECVSYQIYAYQETSGPPLIDSWRHVGDVKAMLLPMAVTLTQFQEGQRYFFAVRAVDVHHRVGPFSVPKTWS